jgi:putative ABC transport system permease protein
MTNFRLAARQLRKSPGFTFVAVATLALGIGVCTAMFSIVHAVVLEPLPFREPERLVWIENKWGGGLSGRTSRADVFNGWREQNTSFETLGAYFAFSDYGPLMMTAEGGRPESIRGVGVSDGFLLVLGVPLLHGRNFSTEECAWQGPGAVILSHGFWQSRFAGDPGVIGRTVALNANPSTIVGVLPASFDFDSVFTPGSNVDVLTPFPLTPETARWGNTIFGIGRLRPGVTMAAAQSEFELIIERLNETLPGRGEFGAKMSMLDDAVRGRFRTAFLVLSGAVACVLAIACVNLSSLLLARMNVRRQEFAVRVALGARKRHLAWQTLSESLLLALAGSLVGVPLAMVATSGLARLQTFGVPLLQGANVNAATLVVTVGLTLLAGIACGVLPALHLSFTHGTEALGQSSHQRTAGRSAAAARQMLVVAEVTLACVLLVGAGLLIRSFSALMQVDPGFQPQHALSWRLETNTRFESNTQAAAYHDALVARVAALPGVVAVGLTDTLPLSRNRTWGAGARGVEYPTGQYPTAYPRIVDDGYLQAMRIPLLAGRFFDARDRGEENRTIIINENLARRAFPDTDPLGKILNVSGGATIVGVVGNVRHSALEQTAGNEMYLNFHQGADWNVMDMVVRSTRPPESLVPEIRATLAAYDANLTNGNFQALTELIDNAVAPRRLITRLLGLFSAIALTLAALGLYGVIAYSVTQRTREIGIRMAVGAQRADVVRLVLTGGVRLVAIGVALGLGLALLLARLLQSLLFGVSGHDPLVFAGIAFLLIAVALAACLHPAWRATRVEPVEALRAE